jgi:hypothetical protein
MSKDYEQWKTVGYGVNKTKNKYIAENKPERDVDCKPDIALDCNLRDQMNKLACNMTNIMTDEIERSFKLVAVQNQYKINYNFT